MGAGRPGGQHHGRGEGQQQYEDEVSDANHGTSHAIESRAHPSAQRGRRNAVPVSFPHHWRLTARVRVPIFTIMTPVNALVLVLVILILPLRRVAGAR
jgi:hypothetical protein